MCFTIVHSNMKTQNLVLVNHKFVQGQCHREAGGNCPLKVSKKRKIRKYWVFSSKLLNISFSDISNKEIYVL